MSIQELAQAAIELGADDTAALERFAVLEDAAFEGYVNDYAQALMICKSCHGG
ncbi:hypothetical protein SAMN05443637_101261 [Pseudonocardia thermophila]|jgi:hypothetical protein|uniref:Uncharacterized protein n=1 Tax=Pseudonocardia thermophila TaxID=1848 RepID=A0A1M6NHP2_PSETH|nr:hypothetical protein [Pseudonocardia thermophila]SHJ95258.1 hypothetical protein SAMN05443637_101261 [Pseudonocardia thermophila]